MCDWIERAALIGEFLQICRKPKRGLAVIGGLLLATVTVTAALIGGYRIDVNLTNSIINLDTE